MVTVCKLDLELDTCKEWGRRVKDERVRPGLEILDELRDPAVRVGLRRA